MYEDFPSGDEPETGEFEYMNISAGGVVGIDARGNQVLLTPDNTRLVLHEGEQRLYDYAIVNPGGEEPSFMKLDPGLLGELEDSGCPVDRPDQPDEAAHVLLEVWSQEAATSLETGFNDLLS